VTYGDALLEGRVALSIGDDADAARDARLLLAAAAGLDMAKLIARSGDAVPAVAQAKYNAYLKRRLNGEPVGRILGETEFWGLRFKLNQATLVPRPETETLVEAVLEEARRRFPPKIAIADLGTGSGVIAIALLSELPEARAVATDISEEALQQARSNARRNGVDGRMSFRNVSFADGPEGPFDVVAANPPYVRSDAIAKLQPEVRDYDPQLALDGGGDGLSAYRAILSRIGELLVDGGLLALEVGDGQGKAVASLCHEAGLAEVRVRPDLARRDRVVTATRTALGANLKVAKKALGKVR
jgi:release factor glutamine methyltransferase